MLNAPFTAAGEAVPRSICQPGYAAKMLELVVQLEDLRHEYAPMPDAIMDMLTAAQFAVGRAIIEAPAIDEAAIATKFRYVALLIEDPDGLMADEPLALESALADLTAFRNAEWMTRFGTQHPWYYGGAR